MERQRRLGWNHHYRGFENGDPAHNGGSRRGEPVHDICGGRLDKAAGKRDESLLNG